MASVRVTAAASSLIALLIATLGACGSSGQTGQPAGTSVPAAVPTAGQIRVDPKGVEQIWVPAGSFKMGTDEATIEQLKTLDPPSFVVSEFAFEQPQHLVRLTHGYWIDRYEVTNESFAAFASAGGHTNRAYWSADGWAWLSAQPAPGQAYCLGDLPKDPVRCVTWYEAEAYSNWRAGRLPTEAQWEFAARGPQSYIYPWGDDWDPTRCNVVGSTGPVPVGSHPNGASWVGAHDLSGNAMEWVRDWLGVDYYAASPTDDPPGPVSGTQKVEKGGWWGGNQFVARSAYRHFEDAPDYQDVHIGFRTVTA
ncbi:MAG: SUMF1/EgtB/PvdO family nonheme iron enzyme [Candidatus Limnocylindrales bacterium]